MKKRIKDLFIGFVVGCLLITTTPVLADSILQKIDVVMNVVSVEINGEKLDANSILYNGSTYLPLRKVAEAVGKDVEWEQTTMTANIINKQEVVNNMSVFNFTEEEYQNFVDAFNFKEQSDDGLKKEIISFYNGILNENEVKQYINIKNLQNRDEILKRIVDEKYTDNTKDLVIQFWYLKNDNTISLLGTVAKTPQGEYRIGFYNCDL
jgi:internalin A